MWEGTAPPRVYFVLLRVYFVLARVPAPVSGTPRPASKCDISEVFRRSGKVGAPSDRNWHFLKQQKHSETICATS